MSTITARTKQIELLPWVKRMIDYYCLSPHLMTSEWTQFHYLPMCMRPASARKPYSANTHSSQLFWVLLRIKARRAKMVEAVRSYLA